VGDALASSRTMLFVSFDFLLFIIPVLLIAWGLSQAAAARTLFLIAASYFFYMAGPLTEPLPAPWYFVGLLALSTVLDFVCSAQIHRETPRLAHPDARESEAARLRRNGWLTLSLLGNLGLLSYFKYTNFFLEAFGDIASAFGFEIMVPHLSLILPVGISFYTFQSLSYTIDVWRCRLTPEPSFRRFALFVVFFPQLVAGPIVRASEFLPQLHRRPNLTAERMREGMFRIAKGLVKKAILGDWIAASFTDAVFASPGTYSSLEVLLALYAFTLQLYADFSGYSDIAIGVARLLGYEIPENFDRPHQARNVGEFWRRWHMTLSTWLRDYLFFPLGGSRGSRARTYFNLWLTMFLVGMWHGASWNFVIYSNIQALAILFNRWNRTRGSEPDAHALGGLIVGLVGFTAATYGLSGPVLGLSDETSLWMAVAAAVTFVIVMLLPKRGGWVNTCVHILLTFHFTVLSRIFFRAENLDASREIVAKLTAFDGLGLREGLLSPWLWAALIGGMAYHFTPKRWIDDVAYRWFSKLPGVVLGMLLCGIGVAIMKLLSGAPRAFIYFQF
ncbi:MAG: MBOAT family O-acyltransferase, partial [Nannocystaceae bacterium]